MEFEGGRQINTHGSYEFQVRLPKLVGVTAQQILHVLRRCTMRKLTNVTEKRCPNYRYPPSISDLKLILFLIIPWTGLNLSLVDLAVVCVT